ncbi:apoptosis-inducing factor 3 isoform X1 [Pan troglodytes]|uniref:apoptosis-inducing factor 3 isoform X1 n=2 Tax=Pan troglodytes TaxID=9598 RepID=UPI0030137F81
MTDGSETLERKKRKKDPARAPAGHPWEVARIPGDPDSGRGAPGQSGPWLPPYAPRLRSGRRGPRPAPVPRPPPTCSGPAGRCWAPRAPRPQCSRSASPAPPAPPRPPRASPPPPRARGPKRFPSPGPRRAQVLQQLQQDGGSSVSKACRGSSPMGGALGLRQLPICAPACRPSSGHSPWAAASPNPNQWSSRSRWCCLRRSEARRSCRPVGRAAPGPTRATARPATSTRRSACPPLTPTPALRIAWRLLSATSRTSRMASVLSRGRVRCPWHGACFNISTGDLEDFPGLDSLHKFQVKIEKEKVYVRASKQALQLQRRTKVMAKCISPSAGYSSSTNVLIVGAGAAGLVCAETLRQEGFSDRIVLCTLDRHLPYDRPKLSKSLDTQPEQLALRPKEFFRAYGIEVLTEAQVVTLDVRNKKVVFKDGFKLEYSKLLLAPGSSPKTLSCKGKEVENVFTIRTPEDANRVVRLARGRNVVVVGAGFLGMEVAAYLTEKAHSVSVVELEETPFRRFLGERVGRALMKMFENNRVKFYMQTEVSELRGQEGKLKEVVLKSSKVVRADVCVVGIGAVPATGFLRQSGIGLDSRGFIPVNKMMQTNVPGVFAAGDAVTFPLAWRNNRKVNIPHWQMAHAQGRVAAQNMLAQEAEMSTVPYLWTAMFGKSLRYAGYGEGFDDVIIQGDLEELKFVAFYTKGDEVIAVASMNYDPIVSKVAEVLASGRAIRKREVELFVLHSKTGDMSWLTGKGS